MDVKTAFIAQIITIVGFAVGLSVLLASMTYPRHIRRSLHAYAYGKFLMAGGFLLGAFRASVAPEILLPLINGCAIAGLCLNLVCIRHLQDKPTPPYLALLCGGAVGVGSLVALLLGPADMTVVRALSSAAAVGILLLIAAELLLFYQGRGVACYAMGVLTLIIAGAFVVRLGAALTQPAAALGPWINDGVERTAFTLIFLGTVIGAINFMLMASDEFNRELIKLANTDGLTGVLNRRRFLELGEIEFRRAKRHHRPLTILIIDIDRFKAINDRGGHPFGDRVIQAVADCCTHQLRQEDGIGRLGGEEFAVLLPETGAEAGERTAERLRAAIEREVAPLGAEHGVIVTCSVGGVTLNLGHGSFADLIAQSDAALYEAKNGGRNRVRFSGSAEATAVHA